MPKSITQYRVFIGSPGGLQDERDRFRKTLELYTQQEAEPRGVAFHAVGWEETVGGVGRPQELINRDLRACDYAVFMLHDRWGTATGSGHTSGTEEEWTIAEELYASTKLRDIALFFKKVDDGKLKDPGDDLKPVIAFRRKVEAGKKYLFGNFDNADQFCDALRGYLGKWLRDHESSSTSSAPAVSTANPMPKSAADSKSVPPTQDAPNFEFWIATANKLFSIDPPEKRDYAGIRFSAEQALNRATSDIQWAEATNIIAIVRFYTNEITSSIEAYNEIVKRLALATSPDANRWQTRALLNKAISLNALNRNEEAIAVYDDLIDRFGAAPEYALRAHVAEALFNRGVGLGVLGRVEEEVEAYEDLNRRFGAAPELALREQVAMALVNRGVRLGELDRDGEAIAVYDDVIGRFGAAPELTLREQVAMAMVNKGGRLGASNKSEEALAVYDDVVGRFRTAPELALREQVAKALISKALLLGALNRGEEAIAVYDDLIKRFGAAPELALRERIAMSLFNKGAILGELGRAPEAISVYDDLIGRFGAAPELSLRKPVAMSLFNKGVHLGQLNRGVEAISVFDDLIGRFGAAPELALREQVAKALLSKGFGLGSIGRNEEAIPVYDDLIGRFGEAKEPTLASFVDVARERQAQVKKLFKSQKEKKPSKPRRAKNLR